MDNPSFCAPLIRQQLGSWDCNWRTGLFVLNFQEQAVTLYWGHQSLVWKSRSYWWTMYSCWNWQNCNSVPKTWARPCSSSGIVFLGGIKQESTKKFIWTWPDDFVSHYQTIHMCIRSGSVIVSDSWSSYHTLKDSVRILYIINHSENFVDPGNVDIYMQNIKWLWQDLKEWIKRPGIRAK